uniref:Uncharacterized protein n=1 Tax=Physcomitrium patens TaxID=3218 RepID=A0A2K1KB61_PHYPA|nr:hypothetical protein PHYPA_010192 [Physcomitrium patens]
MFAGLLFFCKYCSSSRRDVQYLVVRFDTAFEFSLVSSGGEVFMVGYASAEKKVKGF